MNSFVLGMSNEKLLKSNVCLCLRLRSHIGTMYVMFHDSKNILGQVISVISTCG
jgi:hypothetical protein